MSSIKLTAITLEKDQWENVPPLLFKSFYATSMNMTNIRQWCQKQEQYSKAQSEQVQQLQARLTTTDGALEKAQDLVHELSEDIRRMEEQSREQSDTFATCIRQVLCATRFLFAQFGRAYDVQALALCEGEEDEVLSAAPGNIHLDVLKSLGSSVETRLPSIRCAFDTWDECRAEEHEQCATMQHTIEELRIASDKSRERLLSWREMLKENKTVVDSLGAALVAAQASIRDLQETQVTAVDVAEAVQNKGLELQQLLSSTEDRVDSVADSVDGHMAEVERITRELRRQTDERIEEHSAQVLQTLERTMNPVNAYLNTMHVKADAARSEIEQLRETTPKLAAQLEDLDRRLGELGDSSHQRADELGVWLQTLAAGLEDQREGQAASGAALANRIAEVDHQFGERVDAVRGSLAATTDSLDVLRTTELASVSEELATLEQKVARWVRAHPLPAKISEARLYALESRLSEEMDARLQLEAGLKQPGQENMKVYERYTAASRQGKALPALQLEQSSGTPSTACPTPGSSRLSAHRRGGGRTQVKVEDHLGAMTDRPATRA